MMFGQIKKARIVEICALGINSSELTFTSFCQDSQVMCILTIENRKSKIEARGPAGAIFYREEWVF